LLELVRVHDALVRRGLALHAGREVKHTGDGIVEIVRNSVELAEGASMLKLHMWFCSSVSQQSDCSSYRTPGENLASVAETNRSSANGEFATTSGGT
jgi:hypothetical protein